MCSPSPLATNDLPKCTSHSPFTCPLLFYFTSSSTRTDVYTATIHTTFQISCLIPQLVCIWTQPSYLSIIRKLPSGLTAILCNLPVFTVTYGNCTHLYSTLSAYAGMLLDSSKRPSCVETHSPLDARIHVLSLFLASMLCSRQVTRNACVSSLQRGHSVSRSALQVIEQILSYYQFMTH